MTRLLFLISILSLKAYAVSELYQGNDEIKEALGNNMYEPNYITMLCGLVGVIGLVYLTGIVYQKLTHVKIADNDNDKYKPEIISSVSLGQNKNVHVLKVDGEYILVGSTQNNITFLKNLNNDRHKGIEYGENG